MVNVILNLIIKRNIFFTNICHPSMANNGYQVGSAYSTYEWISELFNTQ